jgi:hypothetical protein
LNYMAVQWDLGCSFPNAAFISSWSWYLWRSTLSFLVYWKGWYISTGSMGYATGDLPYPQPCVVASLPYVKLSPWLGMVTGQSIELPQSPRISFCGLVHLRWLAWFRSDGSR